MRLGRVLPQDVVQVVVKGVETVGVYLSVSEHEHRRTCSMGLNVRACRSISNDPIIISSLHITPHSNPKLIFKVARGRRQPCFARARAALEYMVVCCVRVQQTNVSTLLGGAIKKIDQSHSMGNVSLAALALASQYYSPTRNHNTVSCKPSPCNIYNPNTTHPAALLQLMHFYLSTITINC